MLSVCFSYHTLISFLEFLLFGKNSCVPRTGCGDFLRRLTARGTVKKS